MTGSPTYTITQRRTSDLVWDGGLHATVYVDDAPPLQTDADLGWTPELLAATAVGTELMTLVLRQATDAGIEILGYVSEQRLIPANGQPAHVVLAPNASVRSDRAAAILEPLLAGAIETMLLRHAAGEVSVEPRISVARPFGPRG